MWEILTTLDIILFVIIAIPVAYLLFFSITSTRYQKVDTGITRKKGRYLFIVTTTSADTEVENTVKSILKQEYDTKDFDLIVVGDKLSPLQSLKLAQYPITLLCINSEDGTKSQAQLHGIKNHKSMKIYDMVILMNSNEIIPTNFLNEVNKVQQAGIQFFQLHRKPISTSSEASILSCTIEEINNSIFRKGHVAIGMPSALSSSAMVLDYNWYKNNAEKIDKNDGEKSMEALLLKQDIFIDYIDDICVYVTPMKSTAELTSQRKRWMDSRLSTLFTNLRQLLPALLHWNINLSDKLFQWIMIPRIIMMAIIILMSVGLPFIYFTMALKWWAILLIITFAFALATPDYIVDEKWTGSFKQVPKLVLSSVYNLLFQNKVTKIIGKYTFKKNN